MEHRDAQLQKLMNMSKMEMPFDDFEEKVMAQIAELEASRTLALQHKKYALIFFVLGALFGLGLNYMLEMAIDLVEMKSTLRNVLALGCQMFYVILIVVFSDKLWRLRRLLKEGR